jgi:hypothetical protein
VVLSEHPDPRGIRVGFLTTLPPVSTTQLTGFPARLRPIQDGDAATDTSSAMGRGGVQLRVASMGWTGIWSRCI